MISTYCWIFLFKGFKDKKLFNHLTYQNSCKMRLCNTGIHVILDRFLPFYPPMDLENQNLKKMKKTTEDIIVLQMYHKLQLYDVWFLRYGVQQTEFFVILDHLLPFYILRTWKINILKIWKNAWWYYHFTHVSHKWQSYDVWFLRYEAWQTEIFVISDCFLLFYPC